MLQDNPTFPHLWLLASNAITAILTFATTLTALWFKRKREPAEIARITAETRQITVSTDVSLMQAATEALSKALHLQDRCNLLECQVDDLKRDVEQAIARANAAEMFTEQLNMAAKLTVCEHFPSGVRLRDHTPQQLKRSPLDTPKD